jgi:YidC/Oxa1 family membrane protein insertase
MSKIINRILHPYKDLLRFKRLSKSERHIVIYSESSQDYHFFENILKYITQDFGKKVCYLTSDADDRVFGTENLMVLPFYIGQGLSRTILFQMVEANVFVLTMLDLHNLHLKRSPNDVHYILVPHTMVSTHMVDHANAYDNYDTICCVGPHHQQEIKKREELFSLPAKSLLPCGYDRFDVLYEKRNVAEIKETAENLSVLIAPSWGEKALLETCGKKLIEALLACHYRVVLRPHPQTMRLNPTLIDELLQMFGDNKNFIYNPKMRSIETLLEADIMISDWSGVALEFGLALEKPILFVDVPPKMKNPDYQQLGITPIEMAFREKLGHVIQPQDVYLSAEIIEKLMQNHSRPDYDTLRKQALFNIGNSAYITAREIVKIADKQSNKS